MIPFDIYQLYEQLLEAHNKIRAEHGKEPLQLDTSLEVIAQEKADSMAYTNSMNHAGFPERYTQHKYHYIGAAENIAHGCTEVQPVVDMWKNDRPHFVNMVGDFNRVGFGVSVAHNGQWYWCADFAKV